MTIILLGNCSKKRLGKSVEKNLKNVAFNIDIFKNAKICKIDLTIAMNGVMIKSNAVLPKGEYRPWDR